MTRATAFGYYNQEFVNPTTVYEAEYAAVWMEWISIIYLVILGFVPFCACVSGGRHEDKGMGCAGISGIIVRVCWFVTLPIVYHRCNVSY